MDFDATEETNQDDSVAYERYRNRKVNRKDDVAKVIYQKKNKVLKK